MGNHGGAQDRQHVGFSRGLIQYGATSEPFVGVPNTKRRTDNTVRMIKLNNIDGEYLAVGRQTAETSNVLTTFGGDQQSTVSVTGSGIQELEFVDGFRMSIMATQPMTVNTDVVNGISSSMMPDNSMMAVSEYIAITTYRTYCSSKKVCLLTPSQITIVIS